MELTLLKKDNTTFVLPYEQDRELSRKLKVGGYFKAKLVKAHRNILHHKKFYALIKTVLDNKPEYKNNEDVLVGILKIECGVCWVVKKKGKVYEFPKSISFEKMDQNEFQDFYDKALHVMAEMLEVSVYDLENGSLDKL